MSGDTTPRLTPHEEKILETLFALRGEDFPGQPENMDDYNSAMRLVKAFERLLSEKH